jgi:hypothetical protein
LHGRLGRRVRRFAFAFRVFQCIGIFCAGTAVHAFFFTLTTATTTTTTATTALFALARHGFLVTWRDAFEVTRLALTLDQQIGLVFVLAQCFGGFRLLLPALTPLAAVATFTALAAFLTLATRCAFHRLAPLGAILTTFTAAFARLAAATRFACFAVVTTLTRFARLT